MRKLRHDFRRDGTALGEVVSRRRAAPAFRPDPVPESALQELLEMATLAPSGYNLQPWRFIVVREREDRVKLKEAAFGQPKVEEAPVVIIACGDTKADQDLEDMLADAKSAGYLKDEKTAESIRRNARSYLNRVDRREWVTRQTMIAFTYLMLAAESFGLDTAPMEGFSEEKVRAAFGIPEHVMVVALLAIGYGRPPDKPFGGRFDLERVVYEEAWGRGWRLAHAGARSTSDSRG